MGSVKRTDGSQDLCGGGAVSKPILPSQAKIQHGPGLVTEGDRFTREGAKVAVPKSESIPAVVLRGRRPVHRVREATPADAELIAKIADQYNIRKLDVADHPENGWLLQMATPEVIKYGMGHHKDFWLAEDRQGNVLGYQVVTAPRYISRPFDNHKLVGPHQDRARKVLNSGKFLYMSQVAVNKEHMVKGAAKEMQRKVLLKYKHLPLVAHVASFVQSDLDGWDRSGPFDPRHNNVASHKYHQKHGYELVGWTSDIDGAPEFNTGLEPTDHGVAGVMYMHFRDPTPDHPPERVYTDPVAAIIDNPRSEGEFENARWDNPLQVPWKAYPLDADRLMADGFADGFVPNFTVAAKQIDEQVRKERRALRRRLP